jgi:hypothetical protein
MNRTLLALMLWVPCQAALASDWKYAGYMSDSGTKALVAFYDADSVTRVEGTVRYWVKTIPEKALNAFGDSHAKKKNDEFIDAAARKFGSGYVSPLLTVPSLREAYQGDFNDLRVSVIAWELAANRGVRHVSRFLFEIDCARKTMRTLDVQVFDKGGNPVPRSGAVNSNPMFIAPDTNAAWMSELLCAK